MNPVQQSFCDFSTEIVRTGDIDPDYLFLIALRDKRGTPTAFEMIKLKLVLYRTQSELLHHFMGVPFESLPIGAERRKSKAHLEKWYAVLNKCLPDSEILSKFHHQPYDTFRKEFSRLPGMGPWACWKMADLMDKVLGIKMIVPADTFIHAYAYPLKGLLLLSGRPEDTSLYKSIPTYRADIRNAIRIAAGIPGAHVFSPSAILELETLLCKFHSFYHNHYKPGEDLAKLREIRADDRLAEFHEMVP